MKHYKSKKYQRGNILDCLTSSEKLGYHYEFLFKREREILTQSRIFEPGESDTLKRILSVGCGISPPHLSLPDTKYCYVGVDPDQEKVKKLRESNYEAHVGIAQNLPFDDASFDIIFYRLVLHHILFQGPLIPVFDEAKRVLLDRGYIIILEPNIFHPIGLLLTLANKIGISKIIHGTVDDCPLSPLKLQRLLRKIGFETQTIGLEYSWRRLPIFMQKILNRGSFFGAILPFKYFAHTFLIIGRKMGE